MPNLDELISYEEGTLSYDESIAFIADGIRQGWVWKLQGHYGRVASSLIESGQVSRGGDIL